MDDQPKSFTEAVKDFPGDCWGAILLYIEENIDDEYQRNKAMYAVSRSRKTRANNTDKNNIFGGYPALYVFKKVIGGDYKRSFIPTPDQKESYFEYEDISRRA